MILRTALFALVLAVACLTSLQQSFAQDEEGELAKLLASGQHAAAAGDLLKALALFEQAQTRAVALGAKAVAADAALNRARLIESLATKGGDTYPLTDAVELYKYVISIGTLEQQLIAGNDLGVLLIKEKKYPEALEQFRALDYSWVEPSERFAYDYNFGRALEANGNLDAAYRKYASSVTEQPDFDAAAKAAFRILQTSQILDSAPKRIAEATQLADRLLTSGNTELAANQLRQSLKVWSSEPAAKKLLERLVRYYTISSIDPDQFKQQEWEILEPLRDSPIPWFARTPSSFGEAIKEIHLAYVGSFPPTFSQSQQTFRAWSGSSDFSRLLKKIGDYFNQRNDPRRALARYSLAVAVDAFNTEASLYAAAILRAQRKVVDPKQKLFNELLDAIFEEKGESYYEVSTNPHSWQDILRFHVVLGSIFDQEEKWGSSHDPRSAVFQWEHAAEAEKKVRLQDASAPPAAGVHFSLANAYRHVNRLQDAWREYVTAAEDFIKTSRGREAKEALSHANALGIQLDSNDRTRLEELKASIEALL